MARCIRIDVDGSVTELEGDQPPSWHAQQLFEHDVEVVSLSVARQLPDTRWATVGPDVGFVCGTGMFRSEGDDAYRINPKGWALYGYSPIFGPILVSMDSGGQLHPELADLLRRPTWTEMMMAGGADPDKIAAAQKHMISVAHREFGYVMVPGL